MAREGSQARRIALAAFVLAIGLAGSGLAKAAAASPVYIHMNGLNDFLPQVVFVRPGQPVVWVNQDQGAHSIHGYTVLDGEPRKTIDERSLPGTPGPGHKVHTYSVTFHGVGVHYYLCTVHAHLVKVYAEPGGGTYYVPARRQGTNGYRGGMAGVVVVTEEPALLASNPVITRERLLPRFWGNGDESGK